MNDRVELRFENVAKSNTFNNIIEQFDLKNKEVLDIGCSYGEFLVNFGNNSLGITISKDERAYGSSRGLNIILGDIENEDLLINKRFDYIFANNIFEHLNSPHKFLIKIKEYLKPGGKLILGVPCIPKLGFLVNFSKFRGALAMEHVNFFTKNTLLKTVERGDWKIEEERSFYFNNRFLDFCLNCISPHFYIVASPK